MPKTRMITRKIKGLKVKCFFCKKSTPSLDEHNFIITEKVSSDTELEKIIRKRFMTDDDIFISAEICSKFSKYYAMTEEDFVKYAQCFDNRHEITNESFRKAVSENND